MPASAVLLQTTLSLAVPLWIMRIKEQGWTWDRIQERARACADVVAEKGDVLQFKGRKGESAAAFDGLAEGLACAAFVPGGVRFLGMHFEATLEAGDAG
jgi:hypothetical protein